MGIFNGLSGGCGCSNGNSSWWWIIILLLLLDNESTCDSLIWILLLSRFCNGDDTSGCGCGCGCSATPRNTTCGCGC